MGLLDKLIGKKEEENIAGPVDVAGLFDPGVKDVKDTRTLNESPTLQKAIMEYQSPNNVEKREIFVFDSEIRRTPDFYLPYYWAATYNYDRGNLEEARKVLLEGIKGCKVKSVLCRRLAEFCFQKGRMDEALYWFFTTIMADSDSIDFHSYLYLGYVYEAYGMKSAARWMLRRAHGISYKLLFQAAEYSAKKRDNIKSAAMKNKSDAAMNNLENFYRYARQNLRQL